MANMSARHLNTEKTTLDVGAIGGFADGTPHFGSVDDKLFQGPAWFTEKTEGLY